MNGHKTVNAQFTLNGPYTLTLTTSGTGSGTIQASPSGPYYYGVVVTIWANASTGSTFTGFSGDLTGTTTPQTLTMNGHKTVNAQFTLNGPYTLTLTTSGTGSGTIQASPSGPTYPYGTSVTIWANASTGSTFTEFTGDLTGTTTPQTLVIDGNKTVDAAFTKNLTFQKVFFIGSIINKNESDDFITFEPKRVLGIWLQPFSIKLHKTGLITVDMESHGLFAVIGNKFIIGRFYAAFSNTTFAIDPLIELNLNNIIPAEIALENTSNLELYEEV
jgi:hypothetical protein